MYFGSRRRAIPRKSSLERKGQDALRFGRPHKLKISKVTAADLTWYEKVTFIQAVCESRCCKSRPEELRNEQVNT
jgi:hypothetical protein